MPLAGSIITVGLNPAIDRVMEVPRLRLGAHQVGRVVRRAAAGKSVNVSRVLAALEVPSIVTGFIGSQTRSEFDALFQDPRMRNELFALDGRTRENITLVDPAARQETHIRDRGLAVDARSLQRLAAKLRLMARPGGIVVFSGSLPPGAGGEDLADLIHTCRQSGARVAVDTSGEALAAAVARGLWLIKPNAAELAELVRRELPDLPARLAAARRLLGRVELVCLTAGADGAYLFSPEGAWHARAPVDPARVRNTVGCGDVLLGAFIAAVWSGRALPDALAAAVATATAAACTDVTAEFDPAVVEELQAEVQIGPVEPSG